MTERARILVVAATARELATPDGWLTLLCGVGPVEAAARTAAAIAALRPTAILHVGIAGARRARALAPALLRDHPQAAHAHVQRWLGGKSEFVKA